MTFRTVFLATEPSALSKANALTVSFSPIAVAVYLYFYQLVPCIHLRDFSEYVYLSSFKNDDKHSRVIQWLF